MVDGINNTNTNLLNSYYNKNTQGNTNYQTKPLYQLKENINEDTVDLSEKKQTKGMSTGEKLGIGAVLVTGLAVASDYIFAKGKHVNSILKSFKGEAGKAEAKATEEAEAKAAKEAEVKAAKEAEAKAAKKAQAKAAEEAQAKAAEEAQAKAAKEAQAKAAEEAKAKAAKEAQAKAAKEAQAKAAEEAKAKAAKEAQAKAAEEAKVKAAKEAEEAKAKAEAKAAKKAEAAIKYSENYKWATEYADNHMKELDKLFLDKNGKLIGISDDGSIKVDFENLIKPYEGNDIKELYHGTTAEAKTNILKNGFRQDLNAAHGNFDGVGGTYFTRNKNTGYGEGTIVAKANGKLAELDTERVEYILKPYMMRKTGVFPEWKEVATAEDRISHRDIVIRRYLQNKISEKGYVGIVTKSHSAAANCSYVSIIDPKAIQIIK